MLTFSFVGFSLARRHDASVQPWVVSTQVCRTALNASDRISTCSFVGFNHIVFFLESRTGPFSHLFISQILMTALFFHFSSASFFWQIMQNSRSGCKIVNRRYGFVEFLRTECCMGIVGGWRIRQGLTRLAGWARAPGMSSGDKR